MGHGAPAGPGRAPPDLGGLTAATLALWLLAAILAATLPRVETGTDPTRIPVGAIVAPIAATVLTTLAAMTAGVFARSPDRS